MSLRPAKIALTLLCLLSGCESKISEVKLPWRKEAPPATITACAVNDMECLSDRTILRDDPVICDVRDRSIGLFAAGNETVSFQLVIEAGEQPVTGLRLKWSPIGEANKVVAAENIRVFRMFPIKITEFPAWYLRISELPPQPMTVYDALAPIDAPTGGQPFSLAPKERLALWVDVYVPRGTAAGEYVGKIEAGGDGGVSWSAGLKLQVYDLVLPDERPIAAMGGLGDATLFAGLIQRDGKPFVPAHLDRGHPLVQRGLAALRNLMRLSHEHRLDLFDKDVRPLLKRDGTGAIVLEWDDYDAVVLPYLDGTAFDDRIGCPAWPSPFSDSWPDPKNYGGPQIEAYRQTVRSVLAQCRAHWDAARLADRIFTWPYRGGIDSAAYDRYVDLASTVRTADPRASMLCELPPQAAARMGWTTATQFPGLIDVLAPPGQWLEPNLPRPADKRLAGRWLTPGLPPSCPGLSLLASPADVRALPWIAMKYGCKGLLLPEVLNWERDMYSSAAGAENRLFYPGTPWGIDEALPSVRLKRLRRGMQDIAYMAVLRQRQKDKTAESILDAMVRYAGQEAWGDNFLDARLYGWVQQGPAWAVARRILADETQQAVNPGDPGERQLLAQRLAWRDLNERTRRVRIEAVRSRVSIPDPNRPYTLRAAASLELCNEYDRAVDVSVRTPGAPEGWLPAKEETQVGSVGPGKVATATVVLDANQPALPANGRADVPVRISIGENRQIETAAPISLLVAGSTPRPIRIDGALDDWPVRPGNCAGDFRLLGRRGESPPGLAQRQTQAFVLRDRENLYIAFRCHEHNMPGLVARWDNIVRYEQLLACGEDLVEVLLDPGVSAKGVGDLYHVVVKPTGVAVLCKGVNTNSPLGPGWSPWAAQVQAAVSRHQDQWQVELAIPLAAFGPAGQSMVWGVNFTRFAVQGGEASSWCPCARCFYDPRNLGTMIVPPWRP